jgi:hypothetical protein
VKRKERLAQRQVFIETPYPQKKKPRTLVPAVRIPTATPDGRIRQRTLTQPLVDPVDKILKDLDHMWKVIDRTWKEERRKERLQELEQFHNWEGMKRYVEVGGFRAFRNPKVIETLIALQDVEADDTKPRTEREQARQGIETLLKAAKELGSGKRAELTREERKARKRASDTIAKQDQRRLEYAEKAKEKYCQRTAKVETEKILSAEQKKAARQKIAWQILDEEFSKGGATKALAKQDFLDFIKKDPL